MNLFWITVVGFLPPANSSPQKLTRSLIAQVPCAFQMVAVLRFTVLSKSHLTVWVFTHFWWRISRTWVSGWLFFLPSAQRSLWYSVNELGQDAFSLWIPPLKQNLAFPPRGSEKRKKTLFFYGFRNKTQRKILSRYLCCVHFSSRQIILLRKGQEIKERRELRV